MSPFNKSDDILNEWAAITNRAVPPSLPPRPGRSGRTLKLGLAVGVASLLILAVLVPRSISPIEPAGTSPAESPAGRTASPTVVPPTVVPTTVVPTVTASATSGRVTTISTAGLAGGWKGFNWTTLAIGNDVSYVSGPVVSWSHGYAITETLGSAPPTRVFTSTDGVTWTSAFEAGYVAVADGPAGLLVLTAAGDAPIVATTTWTNRDGLHWTKSGNPKALDGLRWLAGNRNAYVATTVDDRGNVSVLRSTDGIAWSTVSVEPGLKWAADSEAQVRSAAGKFLLSGDLDTSSTSFCSWPHTTRSRAEPATSGLTTAAEPGGPMRATGRWACSSARASVPSVPTES